MHPYYFNRTIFCKQSGVFVMSASIRYAEYQRLESKRLKFRAVNFERSVDVKNSSEKMRDV